MDTAAQSHGSCKTFIGPKSLNTKRQEKKKNTPYWTASSFVIDCMKMMKFGQTFED